MIILTCLPLLGAQIGKIGGTLSPGLNCGAGVEEALEMVFSISCRLGTR